MRVMCAHSPPPPRLTSPAPRQTTIAATPTCTPPKHPCSACPGTDHGGQPTARGPSQWNVHPSSSHPPVRLGAIVAAVVGVRVCVTQLYGAPPCTLEAWSMQDLASRRPGTPTTGTHHFPHLTQERVRSGVNGLCLLRVAKGDPTWRICDGACRPLKGEGCQARGPAGQGLSRRQQLSLCATPL